MVSVDRQTLITQICNAYGVEGKNLEAMRVRLSLMDDNALVHLLSGLTKNKNAGLEVERSASPAQTV